MKALIDEAKLTHNLSREEIVKILKSNDDYLFIAADEVRKKYVGDEIQLRGLIEFSNICKHNCHYCGIRCGNKNVERYRLSEKEVLDFAQKAINYGYKTLVLQSGEGSCSVDSLAQIIKEIKKSDIAITLSIGELSFDEYKTLKDAGADRFLLRIETTDEELYKKYHPNMNLQNRKRCLYDIKKLAYETGTGCLVGLPEQTLESLADDILFFKELDADMIGVGPFIPHKDTPLADASGDNFDLALRVMAVTRLLLPDINIPATTAMETLRPNGRLVALQSGANVIMPNVTEGDYKKKYEIYPDKAGINTIPDQYREDIIKKIESIGRTVSDTCGYRGQHDKK